MKKIVLIVFVAIMAACSSSKHSTSASNITAQTADIPSADGSSFEKAIVIQEKSETTGVSAEYKWLREHYPGYKSKGQSLMNHDKKPYDVLSIVTADGTDKKVYFDISNYFGKF